MFPKPSSEDIEEINRRFIKASKGSRQDFQQRLDENGLSIMSDGDLQKIKEFGVGFNSREEFRLLSFILPALG